MENQDEDEGVDLVDQDSVKLGDFLETSQQMEQVVEWFNRCTSLVDEYSSDEFSGGFDGLCDLQRNFKV